MQFERLMPINPTYQQIHQACESAAQKFNEGGWEFDLIVGITRGGLVPAILISHALNLPMTAIQYSSTIGEGEFKQYDNTAFLQISNNPAERILVIDDICDSGHTLKEVVGILNEIKANPVTTFALYFKEREEIVFEPSLYNYKIPENFPWVSFPWEVIND